MVTGGLVANAHGIARSTQDADVVIQVTGHEMAAFQRSLPAGLSLDSQILFETITGSQRQIVEVTGTPFRIELFFLGKDSHHQERFNAASGSTFPISNAKRGFQRRKTWLSRKSGGGVTKRDDARNIICSPRRGARLRLHREMVPGARHVRMAHRTAAFDSADLVNKSASAVYNCTRRNSSSSGT